MVQRASGPATEAIPDRPAGDGGQSGIQIDATKTETFERQRRMRIGIVTPAFNVAPYIGDAIRSVLAQTHRSWTMTIVDDGSSDRTAAIIAGFDDPRIRLVRQRNAGVSEARNRGLAATNAETVLFLDADDWLSRDAAGGSGLGRGGGFVSAHTKWQTRVGGPGFAPHVRRPA
jgi:Glycosyl transferase family 2